MTGANRPDQVHDEGLQHERTALAWERTAVATMVAGLLLARYAAVDGAPAVAVVGLLQVAFGAGLLAWAGQHYEDLHGVLRAGHNPAHPGAVRAVGLATTFGTGLAFALAAIVAIT